jgi:hypothetical protein
VDSPNNGAKHLLNKICILTDSGRNALSRGDYPQVFSPKGNGCKKTKDRVIAVVMTAEMP